MSRIMEDSFEPVSKLKEVEKLLDGFEYSVHAMTDEGYDYLEDESHRCILLKNKAGEELFIDFEDEFTLSFRQWHTHYFAENYDYKRMIRDMEAILHNNAHTVIIYCKDEWMGSILIHGKIKSKEAVIKEITDLLREPEFLQKLNRNGAEVYFQFWNSDFNRELSLLPGEITA